MSPVILPDTSAAEDMDVSVAGTYRARVVKTDAAKTKEKGVQQAILQFELSQVPDEREQKPRDIKRTLWQNTEGPGSMGWDKILRVFGFDEQADRIRNGEKVPFDTDDLLFSRTGKECHVILKAGEYQGRRRDEIAGVLPA